MPAVKGQKRTGWREAFPKQAVNPYCVLAIDQSSDRAGFAVVDSRLTILHLEALKFDKKQSHKLRRRQLVEKAQELIASFHPVAIITEYIREFSSRKEETPFLEEKKDFHSRDVIRCFHRIVGSLIDNTDLPVYSIATTTMKANAFRDKMASKAEAARQVSYLMGYKVTHDEAEAAGFGTTAYCSTARLWIEE